ncbi:MAG: hypothetical protein IT371_17770 [Deltaproteobacteria bacterium]|nr:hypothetical protein [Deltaproteobacteria bacterium]
MSMIRRVLIVAGLCAAAVEARGEARPRFYLEVRGVRDASAGVCGKEAQLRAALLAELKKRPEVVTDLGSPPPKAEALEGALKERRLVGYALLLRVVRCGHEVKPPAKGKVYRTLSADVAVALDAEKIPSGQMALAGDGDAQVATEVGEVKDKERKQLLAEALAEATKQAVTKSVQTLSSPPKGGAKGRGKKGRKR